ncbi:MAG: pentapeptide repeat-containing protein [Anaerolineales bacterium]
MTESQSQDTDQESKVEPSESHTADASTDSSQRERRFSGLQGEIDSRAVIAAISGILGAIIGAWLQGYVSYHYEVRRVKAALRKETIHKALEWSATGRRDSFRGADLEGADLSDVDLGASNEDGLGADLSHCDLSNADLAFSDLREANLNYADLTAADLMYANLRGAQLYGTMTEEAWFMSCDLQKARIGTDFINVDLAMADFRNAETTWSSFEECNLTTCDFRGADLSKTSFRGSRLIDADMRRVNLSRSSLVGADLSFAKLNESVLLDCDLRGATLKNTDLYSCTYNTNTLWPEGFVVPSQTIRIDYPVLVEREVQGDNGFWHIKRVSREPAPLDQEELLRIIERSEEDPVLKGIPHIQEGVQKLKTTVVEMDRE